LIELHGVSKSYNRGSVKAVNDLNLTVPPGRIFGFLGPNGAGKTTTIKMIVGLLPPDNGRVLVNGIDVWQDSTAARKQIGFVPDTPEVYEHLTGIEYINFITDVYRVPAEARQERLLELMDTFEMQEAMGDLIQSYSHGMRQKIVIMGALIHDPPVLILDEPMVGLDPRSSKLLKDIMRRRCDEGKVVFFSTHVLDVAERLCDTVAIIRAGNLIACDSIQNLRCRAGGNQTLESIFLELTET